mmetsp:Transcript_24563/g.73299  ORF Transcript_24563/g.73299 Transcript_24563/m.73299 type:complete len:263 (-) Transcript_24563:430-1218(-)
MVTPICSAATVVSSGAVSSTSRTPGISSQVSSMAEDPSSGSAGGASLACALPLALPVKPFPEEIPEKRPDLRMSRRSWALSREKVFSCEGFSMFFLAQVWAAASPFFSLTSSQAASALAAAKASDQSQNSFILDLASSLRPWACRKGDRPPETASKAAVGPCRPSSEPSMAARPSCGVRGSRARTSPTGKRRGGSPSSSASMARRSSMAASRASAPGGSGASLRKPLGSRPRAAAWRQLWAKSQRCISGAGRAGARSSCPEL